MLKKMLNLYVVNLKKIFTTYKIYLSVIICYFICMITYVYDDGLGKSYNIITLLNDYGINQIRGMSYELDICSCIKRAITNNIAMFAPMICIIPLTDMLVLERKNNINRFIIERSGKAAYIISNFITSCIVGVIVLIIGIMMYCMTLKIMIGSTIDSDVLTPILMCVVVLGIMSVLGAVFISEFTKNLYLVLCVPFIISYLVDMLVQNMTYSESVKYTVLSGLSVRNIFYIDFTKVLNRSCITIVYGVIVCVVLVTNIFMMKFRVDVVE